MDELRDVVPIGEHALLDRTVHRTLWDVLWQDEQRELAEFETIEKKLAEFHEPAVVVSGYPKERLMGSDSAVDLVTLPYQEAPLENERDTAAAHATKVSKSSVNMEEGAHIQRRADEEEKVHAENDVAQDVTSEDQSRSNNPLFDDSTFVSYFLY